MHVLHLQQVDAMTAADRTGLLVAQAMSGEEVELPTIADRREAFETALNEPAKELSAAHQLLRRWGVE